MTAPDKLSGIKPGDRVRVTFEGVVQVAEGHLRVSVVEGSAMVAYGQELDHESFHIERIEPPLKVGDRVRPRGSFGDVWKVVAMEDGYAVVYASQTARVVCPDDLERIA